MAKELPSIGYKGVDDMQVFIVGSIFETIKALDKNRRRKQWIEVQQIIDALNGKKAWNSHPCTIQYKDYQYWLILYRTVIEFFNMSMFKQAEAISKIADMYKPAFHTDEFYEQMKRRLYTKNKMHYSQWSHLGESDCNWYWSPTEDKFIKYINGKRI